jgi:hypothetical protein
MIQFYLEIKNPFFKTSMNEWQRVYFEFAKNVTKNKTFDMSISRHAYYLFSVNLNLDWRGNDHAGPKLQICLFGYSLHVNLSDNRHWNDEENRWVNYDNPEEVKKYW